MIKNKSWLKQEFATQEREEKQGRDVGRDDGGQSAAK
jgi:hypothetical protein